MSVRLVANDRTGDGAGPAPAAMRVRTGSATMEDDRWVPLPRNLLVGLHALAADIALVREGHETDPLLCTSLDQALWRLDGLVESIYDLAAASSAPAVSAAPQASRRRRTSAAREASPART